MLKVKLKVGERVKFIEHGHNYHDTPLDSSLVPLLIKYGYQLNKGNYSKNVKIPKYYRGNILAIEYGKRNGNTVYAVEFIFPGIGKELLVCNGWALEQVDEKKPVPANLPKKKQKQISKSLILEMIKDGIKTGYLRQGGDIDEAALAIWKEHI